MKILKTTVVLLCVLVFTNCSSVKVLNSWSSDSLSDFKDNNILVIARTDDQSARIAFENSMKNGLKEMGINAKSSFTIMPNLNPDAKLDSDQVKAVEEALKREGYNGVLISVIKDVQQTTQTTQDGGYYAGATFYPSYYGGFYGYYNNPMSYSTYGNYVPATYSTNTYKTYVLETVAYDLDKPLDKQLAAIVTSEIDEPDNLKKDASDYTKKVLKALKK